MLQSLPLDVVGLILDKLPRQDQQHVLQSHPLHMIDAFFTTRHRVVHIHDSRQDVSFLNKTTLSSLTFVCDRAFSLLSCLRRHITIAIRCERVNIEIQAWENLDACYAGINNIDDVLLRFFDTKEVSFLIDSEAEDPVFVVKRTDSITYLSVDFRVGLVGVQEIGDSLSRLQLHGSRILKSTFSFPAPNLRHVKIRGKLTGYRTGPLTSTKMFDGGKFDTLDIGTQNQQDADLLLYTLQDALEIDHLIIRYEMPLVIMHACRCVKHLTLRAKFDACVDLVYHTMLMWSDLTHLEIQRGCVLNAIFTAKISEADDYDLRHVLESLLRWNITTDEYINLEIDRWT
jgi:hypothetical protein